MSRIVIHNYGTRDRRRVRDADEDPCWEGYEQQGMKEKNGKKVPNCVKLSDSVTARMR